MAAGQPAPVPAPSAESKILLSQVDDILRGLSDITGWKVRKPVPAEFIGKDKLRDFVEKRMKEVIKPEDLRIESLTCGCSVGPEDFDLEKATVELVTEQAAAFYDYNEKRLYIIENSSTFLEQRVVLVHELAHALADQQFSLANYIRKGNQNDDDATAREAVMEGQATWLMWAYSSRLNGGDARPSETMLDLIRGDTGSGGGAQYPVFDKSPLYMRESLVFPYNHGALFQEAVFDHYGKAGFSEVFRRAPRTTAQILHPDMYFNGRQPSRLKAPEPPDSRHYKMLADGSVGEFDHRILLEQYVSKAEAARLAPHWRGGAFRLYESRNGKRPVLTWASEWDTPEAARSWFEAYGKVLRGKSQKLAGLDAKGGTWSGSNEYGVFRVQCSDTRVSAVEGLPATLN